ncbi:putative ADP-ribosylglycohydrolase [Erwinia phage pEa_SNUABM_47]|uniref:Putative ADP-ribosylglycohydrolase n=1 Tax=Erwinia phage pEa_SNUABM_47 TaxID=2768774 RepID=A0A7L8ZNV0_9CAUD|nr:putative ADP-ribosylglycohydrolase [Erwinia phage pEa_SNUABM_47]
MSNNLDRSIGALVGLAVGDALGTTLEFHQRDTYELLTDIVGGGPFQLNAGEWTDDTSMALCLGHSLLARYGFDAKDQLTRYCNWMNYGYMSSTGKCFDIGTTTKIALRDFLQHGTLINNHHFLDSGNGSLMRLAPITIFYNTKEMYSEDFVELLKYSELSSSTTHAHQIPVQSCVAFSIMLNRAIHGYDKVDIIDIDEPEKFGIFDENVKSTISLGNILSKTRNTIKSTGYVIDSLEAALWCFITTDSFKEAVLLAANLGDDADTVAAITGQIAGAYYGINEIPTEWVNIITDSKEIITLAENLYNWRN